MADRLETEFLAPALEIEETPASPLGRTIIWLVAAVLVTAAVWSYLGRVDTVAVARGKIIPDGEIKVLQPMREGVVKAIHVKEGQRVRKGQVLIELDPTIKEADMESNLKMSSIYHSDKNRLLAELKGQDLGDAQPVGTKGVPGSSGKVASEIGELQKTLKTAKDGEYRAREEGLLAVIAQREHELKEAQTNVAKYEKVLPILREEERTFRTLSEEGIVPRVDFLTRQKELYTAEHELEAQKTVVRQKVEAIDEAKKNLSALAKEREKTILTGLIDMEKSIASVEGEVTKARKEHEFDRIVSPVDGYVHELGAHTIGGVVKPAQPIVTVVPDGTALVIEAKALNTDIGFLRVGQETEVKIDTFPFQKYGTIPGKLAQISPDAVEDQKLGEIYNVRATLSALALAVDGARVSLTPGMTVSLEIKTGKRRVIEFFLSPIVKYAKESLTVR